MVIYVGKWDIRPEKAEEYPEWARSTVRRLLAVPGLVEFRGYRPATGCNQVIVTYEFTDMQAWASWRYNEDVQKVWDEASAYLTNTSWELWGPSPVVPEPIRSGQ
jgi:heme-degrading monooxygenase HmoA